MNGPEWEAVFTGYLPARLRPAVGDSRFAIAAEQVAAAGWSPWAAASIVAGHDYTNARVPAAVALLRLEALAGRGPTEAPAHAVPCHVDGCHKGWIDNPAERHTAPCPHCRPQLAARLAMIPGPGKRSERDQAYLREGRQ